MLRASFNVDDRAQPARPAPDRWQWAAQVLVREMWASLPTAVMRLAVLIALFAAIGTRGVARYGFGRRDDDADR